MQARKIYKGSTMCVYKWTIRPVAGVQESCLLLKRSGRITENWCRVALIE